MNRDETLQSHPFAVERGRQMVVGTDIDAILSAAYMQTYYDWEAVGFYDLTNVYYDSDASPLDAVWVDLDVARSDVDSIGHHILTEDANVPDAHTSSLNPNLLRGHSHANFSRKFPTSTLHLLMWLHDHDEDYSYEQKALCWLADSAWINGQQHRYKSNVQDWVEQMPGGAFTADMSAAIDTAMFEETIEQEIIPAIKRAGWTVGRTQVQSRHRSLKGFQCSFNDPREKYDELEELADYISWRLPFEKLQLPELDEVEYGTRSKENLSDIQESYGGLDGLADNRFVFSYAETFPGTVNFTSNIRL